MIKVLSFLSNENYLAGHGLSITALLPKHVSNTWRGDLSKQHSKHARVYNAFAEYSWAERL